jgi:hypothetical protein
MSTSIASMSGISATVAMPRKNAWMYDMTTLLYSTVAHRHSPFQEKGRTQQMRWKTTGRSENLPPEYTVNT